MSSSNAITPFLFSVGPNFPYLFVCSYDCFPVVNGDDINNNKLRYQITNSFKTLPEGCLIQFDSIARINIILLKIMYIVA